MNKELAIQKGLIINNDENMYIVLQEIYKYLFEVYMFSKINLKKYDEEIKNADCYFGKSNPTKEQLISGLREFMNLDYLYILNNFYIEKLELNDIEMLKKCLGNKVEATPELLGMIERTYKDVIKKNFFKGEYTEDKYKVCYGTAIPSNFADNDALVLKMYYSKNTKELQGQEFIDNLRKQKTFIDELKEKIKKEIEEKLNISCDILDEKVPN